MDDQRDTGQDTADTEAHAYKSGRRNEDAAPQDEAEREPSAPDEDDDVEGHRAYSSSDARLKTDIRPL